MSTNLLLEAARFLASSRLSIQVIPSSPANVNALFRTSSSDNKEMMGGLGAIIEIWPILQAKLDIWWAAQTALSPLLSVHVHRASRRFGKRHKI